MMTNPKLKIAKKIGFWLLITFICIYLLFPFYWAINSSLKTEDQLMMMPATFLPRDPDTGAIDFTLKNYIDIFNNKSFMNGIVNSAIVATTTTLLSLITGSFAAFALGKLRFRGKKLSLYVILSMTMFPQVTVLAGLYAVVSKFNLGPRFSMIVSYMLFALPFTTWVLTSFFKDLPDEIMQSAQVDGATAFQTFRMILLPLTAPALVTTGLLTFIRAWNEYLFALTFTSFDQSARTIPVAIALFSGQVARQEPAGAKMAAAVTVTVPIVILVLIFQKRIVKGLTAGSVKG